MVRVTYPVADLVMPISGYPAPDKKETLAKTLIQVITNTVARDTWSQAGGNGTVEYFPFGMAIVVCQSNDVHAEIARLLIELRRLQDVQVGVELRAVHVSASMAKHLLLDMDEHGKAVRVIKDGKESPRCVSMDDKQIAALLKLAQSNETTKVTQAPKVMLFNCQQARLGSMGTTKEDGFEYEILPVLDAEKFVRLTLSLQHSNRKAAGTFVVAPGRTLVWHMGENLFMLATPRVVVAEEGAAEEQSLPEPRKADKFKGSAKERAIEYRLRQPINLHLEEMPLRKAIQHLAVCSGVQVVLDERGFQEGHIDPDIPLAFAADNISMKSALNLMIKELGLTFVIENDVLKVTTPARIEGRLVRKTYDAADLVKSIAQADAKTADVAAELIRELVQTTVAKNSWEPFGGAGNIQYFPREKKFVVNQTNDVHEEIESLLAALRRLYDLSVEVELRFVQTSASTAKEWRKVLAKKGKSVDAPITETQLVMLLESAQGDRTTTVTQAPKLTLLNGQRGGCGPTDKTVSGWRSNVLPVVSADRRSVRLKLDLEHFVNDESKSIEIITKAAKIVSLPDGQTMVWDLGETVFRQNTFVVVTPRIRERSEERIFLGLEPPIPGR